MTAGRHPDPPVDVARARTHPDWTQWVTRGVVALLVAMLAHQLVTNPNFEWDVVFEWLFAPSVLRALWTTLWLAAVSMVIGVVLGVVFAVLKMSDNRLLRWVADAYLWFFRGTPLLVQLIFWFNLAALVPTLGIGIPFGGPQLASWETNDIITPLTAAIFGLALNEGAYMAEVIRGGLLSVPRGQREAAKAYGMTESTALRRVVLPQAMRAIIPPTGNQLISMVKATAMVSVIAMHDLLYTVQAVYNRTFQTIPLLLVAVIWYLLVVSILSVIQHHIEEYYGKSDKAVRATSAKKKDRDQEEPALETPRIEERA
ncbi:amino acid ABC transporter permease [Ornithinimicrobium pekingense]|uniref:ABC transporter permease n=1 Tax=Ornithinimicrobium pekingense TaxID=384677 RepID=A0ABQ2F476_9MICO|nr:amino acid ABC transporter permease [Ornithinimicrobium pekingense]GGK60379.1 ABC transporter permease [Ornithinimicrobium pekingense]